MNRLSHILRLRFLLGGLVVSLLLWWAWHDISLTVVWTILHRLGLAQILLLIGVNVTILLILSGRWWLILWAQGYLMPYLALAGYRLAAFGVSYFTPGPQFGGEPLQVYLVQHRHHVPLSTAISTVVLDKSMELLANFTFLTIGIIVIIQGHIFPTVGWPAILLALGLLILPVSFLLILCVGRQQLSGLWLAAVKLLPRREVKFPEQLSTIYTAIRDSEDQATCFCQNHNRTMVLTLLVSVISWGAMLGEYWLVLYLLGLNLTLAQAVSALTAARLAFLLPLPAGLGVLEASQVLALSMLGFDPALAMSLSLVIRLRDITLAGLGLGWGSLVGMRTGEHLKTLPHPR